MGRVELGRAILESVSQKVKQILVAFLELVSKMNNHKENGQEINRMRTEEIKELMELKGWTTTHLAFHLDLTANAVAIWLMRDNDKPVKGPASVLMRQWLNEERGKMAGAK
jgi:hypothetical protein